MASKAATKPAQGEKSCHRGVLAKAAIAPAASTTSHCMPDTTVAGPASAETAEADALRPEAAPWPLP